MYISIFYDHIINTKTISAIHNIFNIKRVKSNNKAKPRKILPTITTIRKRI